MRIEASRVVAAPPEAVFGRLTDFAVFEARARQRNLPLERLAEDPPGWRIGVAFRGLDYEVELRLVSVTPPAGYVAELSTRGIDGVAGVAVAPEAGGGSLLTVTLEAAGRGLAGRAALRGLGFVRPYLETQLTNALSRLGKEIEGRA